MPSSLYKPQRKIGIQTRSVTGTLPCGNRYESSLERDLVELLRGDPDFESFHSQPVKVPFKEDGFALGRPYVPDGLIFWKSVRAPLLVEVKFRADCAGQWRQLRRKYKAAERFCDVRGWQFAIVTEDDIRGQRLLTVRFLQRYQARSVAPTVRQLLLQAVCTATTTPKNLVQLLNASGVPGPEATTAIWTLVAQGAIKSDWDQPLTMASTLWGSQDA